MIHNQLSNTNKKIKKMFAIIDYTILAQANWIVFKRQKWWLKFYLLEKEGKLPGS